MTASLSKLIPWLIRYKYAVIFPIAIFEGPVITIITGFLVSLGYLNFWLAYAVIILGDLVGDSGYYFFGKYGRSTVVKKYGHKVGITPEHLVSLENHFKAHSTRELIIGKVSHA
jgi:membrane-associated protein